MHVILLMQIPILTKLILHSESKLPLVKNVLLFFHVFVNFCFVKIKIDSSIWLAEINLDCCRAAQNRKMHNYLFILFIIF